MDRIFRLARGQTGDPRGFGGRCSSYPAVKRQVRTRKGIRATVAAHSFPIRKPRGASRLIEHKIVVNARMPRGPKFEPHPASAPGDFYVEKGECLACGYPHIIAPDLIGWADDKRPHCIWKKQPRTQAEVDRAIAVLDAQDLECHRYAGTDPTVLSRVSPRYCDYPLPTEGPPAEPHIPSSALLNQPSLTKRLWRKIVGRNRS
jgi:hypothetical protein